MGTHHNKQLGTAAECIVTAELIKRDWYVSTPEGDYAPYDRIITKGRFIHKVQVKSATKFNHPSGKEKAYKWTIRGGHSKKNIHDRCDIDVYIFVGVPTNEFLIIPYDIIYGMKTISVNTSNIDDAKWGIYLGAWGLLENKGFRDTIQDH
jgi:hypothetical protein